MYSNYDNMHSNEMFCALICINNRVKISISCMLSLRKLDDRSKEMVFVGYEKGTTAYQCFDATTHKLHLSRDVIFEEEWKWNFVESQSSEVVFYNELIISGGEDGLESPIEEVGESGSSLKHVFQEEASNGDMDRSQSSSIVGGTMRFQSDQSFYDPTAPIEEESLISFEDPTTYLKASQEEAWRKVMEEEIASIEKNDKWTLVKALKACKPIGVKWDYKLKKNQLEEVVKHKSRLVVKR